MESWNEAWNQFILSFKAILGVNDDKKSCLWWENRSESRMKSQIENWIESWNKSNYNAIVNCDKKSASWWENLIEILIDCQKGELDRKSDGQLEWSLKSIHIEV